jgi:hypothetical protein
MIEISPQIEERSPLPYLGIVREVTDGVPAAVDTAFPELFGRLGEQGIAPAGPPFIRYHELDRDGEPLLLEAACPVADGTPGDVRVLPEGRYLTYLHVGPYRSDTLPDLGAARAALVRWAREHGIVYARETERGLELPCCVDHLRIGPVDEADFTKWETELAYLIVG